MAVLISLKLALKCAYEVKGPYNPAIGYYFAELYDDFFVCWFSTYKITIHFFPETGKSWVIVLGMECFVSCLTYSFPILTTCFEASGVSLCLFCLFLIIQVDLQRNMVTGPALLEQFNVNAYLGQDFKRPKC